MVVGHHGQRGAGHQQIHHPLAHHLGEHRDDEDRLTHDLCDRAGGAIDEDRLLRRRRHAEADEQRGGEQAEEGHAEVRAQVRGIEELHRPPGEHWTNERGGEAAGQHKGDGAASKLRARREQPIGLVYTTCDEVVDQHADVCVVASEHNRLLPMDPPHRIDPGDDTLAGRFFITRRAVDLAGEEEVLDHLHLEPGGELRRWIVVVLDCVAWSSHPRVLKAGHRVQEFHLYGDGKGSRQAVDV